MESVRFGLVGLGNMGSFHAAYMDSLLGGKLGALCDVDPKKLEEVGKKHDEKTLILIFQALEKLHCYENRVFPLGNLDLDRIHELVEKSLAQTDPGKQFKEPDLLMAKHPSAPKLSRR